MISKADTGYDARTSFSINAGGNKYKFEFVYNDLYDQLPRDYEFKYDALEEVIFETAKGLNISFASAFDSDILDSILAIASGTLNSLFSLFQNAVMADAYALGVYGFTDGSKYGWKFEFTGSDPDYPGSATYGTAYGFRFTGWCFETVDLVLDSEGNLYGSNPIGNFTLHSETNDYIYDHIIHQQDINGEWAVPNISAEEHNGIPPAFFDGKDLHFFGMAANSNTPLEYVISDCSDTSFCVYTTSSGQGFLSLMPLDDTWNQSIITYPSGTQYSFTQGNTRNYINWRSYLPNSTSGSHRVYDHQFFNNSVRMNFNLPNFTYYLNTVTDITTNNSLGFINNTSIQGSADLYLNTMRFTSAPDVPDIPVGDPVPFDDLPVDPTDYEPDPSSDPDPVPGIQYDPDPGPELPEIPPIVSGNDDLWPDLNVMFDFELDLDGFLGPLLNFDFPDFNTVIDSVLGPLSWISGIMSLLYEGSDFGILFTILAVFFIASAILGIYKWWNN